MTNVKPTTFQEFIQIYREFSSSPDSDYYISVSTLNTYCEKLSILSKKFPDKTPDQLQEEDINKYFQDMRKKRLKISYLNVIRCAFNSAWDFWKDLGYAENNPIINIKLSKKKGRGKHKDPEMLKEKGYSIDELKKLFFVIKQADKKFDAKNLRVRDALIFAFLYSTNLRIDELFPNPFDKRNPKPLLLVKAINWENRTVQVQRKGGWIRDVLITDLMKDIIPEYNIMYELKHFIEEQQLQQDDQLFTIKKRQASNLLEKWGKLAGLERRNIHNFRHSYGRALTRKGIPGPVITMLMDHQDEDTTKEYTKLERIDRVDLNMLIKMGIMPENQDNQPLDMNSILENRTDGR